MSFVIVFEGREEYKEEFNGVKIFETNCDPASIEDCSWYCCASIRRCHIWLAVEVHPVGVHSCQEQSHPHHDNAKAQGKEKEEEVEKVESTSAFLSCPTLDLENSNFKVE